MAFDDDDDDPRAALLAELDSPDAARLLASGAVPILSWRQGSLYRERHGDGDPQFECERPSR